MPDFAAYDAGREQGGRCCGDLPWCFAWRRSALSWTGAPNAARSGMTGCNRQNPANRTAI